MTTTTHKAWTDSKGRELLVQKGPDEFYTPLGHFGAEILKELAEAAADAAASVAEDEKKEKD